MAAWPSRVRKGTKMAGRMGNAINHVRNITVVEVDPENNILLVRGAVPGAKNAILRLTATPPRGGGAE